MGNHCIGAKVNGSIVPLTYTLQTGDRVEILTQKNATPSRDWLGIVKSPRARSKIRAYFSKITRNDDQVRGRDLVMHELRKDGVGVAAAKALPYLESVAVELSYESTDDLLVAVGSGKYSAKQLAHRIIHAMNKEAEVEEEADKPVIDQLYLTNGSNITAKPRSPQERSRRSAHNKTGVVVKGLDDVYVRLSHCCNPLPGDDIIGFITRGRGVSVHRADCPNAADLLKHPERMIDVAWESEIEASVYQVEIYVEAIDRLRLLQDIVMTLADAGVNIIFELHEHPQRRDRRDALPVRGRRDRAHRRDHRLDQGDRRRVRRYAHDARRKRPPQVQEERQAQLAGTAAAIYRRE